MLLAGFSTITTSSILTVHPYKPSCHILTLPDPHTSSSMQTILLHDNAAATIVQSKSKSVSMSSSTRRWLTVVGVCLGHLDSAGCTHLMPLSMGFSRGPLCQGVPIAIWHAWTPAMLLRAIMPEAVPRWLAAHTQMTSSDAGRRSSTGTLLLLHQHSKWTHVQLCPTIV
jgi:hypothetical protein